MNAKARAGAFALAALIAYSLAGVALAQAGGAGSGFDGSSAKITNRYLPISNYHRCVLQGDDGGQRLKIVRVLLNKEKVLHFGGHRVKAAVVRDTVTNTRSDRKIEQTTDYFAQDRRGGVHYLGEDVNEYLADGSISHEGQWRVGRQNAKVGLLMPAHPKVGRTFKSENARNVAVERDHIVADGLKQTIRGQSYKNVVKIREHATTPKPAEFETKTYAPGVGVITEANGGVGLDGC